MKDSVVGVNAKTIMVMEVGVDPENMLTEPLSQDYQ